MWCNVKRSRNEVALHMQRLKNLEPTQSGIAFRVANTQTDTHAHLSRNSLGEEAFACARGTIEHDSAPRLSVSGKELWEIDREDNGFFQRFLGLPIMHARVIQSARPKKSDSKALNPQPWA